MTPYPLPLICLLEKFLKKVVYIDCSSFYFFLIYSCYAFPHRSTKTVFDKVIPLLNLTGHFQSLFLPDPISSICHSSLFFPGNTFFRCLPGYHIGCSFSASFTSSSSPFLSLNVGKLQNSALGLLLFSVYTDSSHDLY